MPGFVVQRLNLILSAGPLGCPFVSASAVCGVVLFLFVVFSLPSCSFRCASLALPFLHLFSSCFLSSPPPVFVRACMLKLAVSSDLHSRQKRELAFLDVPLPGPFRRSIRRLGALLGLHRHQRDGFLGGEQRRGVSSASGLSLCICRGNAMLFIVLPHPYPRQSLWLGSSSVNHSGLNILLMVYLKKQHLLCILVMYAVPRRRA